MSAKVGVILHLHGHDARAALKVIQTNALRVVHTPPPSDAQWAALRRVSSASAAIAASR